MGNVALPPVRQETGVSRQRLRSAAAALRAPSPDHRLQPSQLVNVAVGVSGLSERAGFPVRHPGQEHQLKMAAWLCVLQLWTHTHTHVGPCCNITPPTSPPQVNPGPQHILIPFPVFNSLLPVILIFPLSPTYRRYAELRCQAEIEPPPRLPPSPNIKGSEPETSPPSCGVTISSWNAFSRLSNVWKIGQIKGCSVETLLLICPEISCA